MTSPNNKNKRGRNRNINHRSQRSWEDFFHCFHSRSELHRPKYPRWFLDPVELKSGLTASGYAQYYFEQDSSDSAAQLNAWGAK